MFDGFKCGDFYFDPLRKTERWTLMSEREHLAPTDIICIICLVLLAALYALTRETDIRAVFLGLVMFTAGRLSKKNGIVPAN
jgi:hypothetical protein